MNEKDKKELREDVNKTFLGLSGTIWCLIAGLCYGSMNVFSKLSYEKGMIVSRVTFMRFFVLFVSSYTFGKLKRGVNFDLRKYDRKVILVIVFRSFLSMCSKCL